MKLFSPNGNPLNRAAARNAMLLNLLATPGLGSILGRRWIAGSGQLRAVSRRFRAVLVWFVKEMSQYYGQISGDVEVRPIGRFRKNCIVGRGFIHRRLALVVGDQFQPDARSLVGQTAVARKFRRAAGAKTGRGKNPRRARLGSKLAVERRENRADVPVQGFSRRDQICADRRRDSPRRRGIIRTLTFAGTR